jgi:hemoglobin
MSEITVFEAAGGASAFLALTTAFYGKVVRDPVLAPVFGEMSAAHVEGVALWLGEVFGGPLAYTEQRGGYPAMLAHHVNRSLTEEQRARWAELTIATAREVLPADERVQARIASYIEWGSRIALQNSRPGYDPPAESDIPDWGWGKAGPPDATPGQ